MNPPVLDEKENSAQEAKDSLKKAAGKVGKAVLRGGKNKGKKAGSEIARKIMKLLITFLKAIVKLIISVGWIGAVVLAVLIVVALAWNFLFEERGSTASVSLEPAYTNPTQQDEFGVQKAIALTEPQALIDAYYKYMACNSYIKFYGDKRYQFNDPNQTEDFAGLQDYYKNENYYYLSSSFIQMADEHLHQGEFFFPEQIIKSVYFKRDENQRIKTQHLVDDEGNFIATSKAYDENDMSKQTDEEIPGVWDYGFGSVLQYEPHTKDKYISCIYESFQIDVHTTAGDGRSIHVEFVDIPISSGDNLNSLKSKIDAYETGATYVSQKPSNEQLEMYLSPENQHIPMKIDPEDQSIAERTFQDTTLAPFSNAGNSGYYPLNIPLIVSAATFSGNIEYRYEPTTTSSDLNPSISSDPAEPVTQISYGTNCMEKPLIATRSGSSNLVLPTLAEPLEEPWGFEYMNDYISRYVCYVPKGIQSDLNFVRRTEDPETWNFLIELGLMKKYSSGSLSPSGTVDAEDVTMLSKLISAEAGPNKLDELMVGSVVMNRVASPLFPNTMLEVISQGNGAQYACWSNGSYQNATPTPREIESAKQVLTGEFALPSNIIFQSASMQGNLFHSVVNGTGFYTHHYCYPRRETLATTDRLGRPALSAAQAVELASSLDTGGGGSIEDTNSEGVDKNAPQLSSTDSLYAVNKFDVVTATGALQKVTDKSSFGWLGQQLGQQFDSILDQIHGFFNAIKNIFSDNIMDTPHSRYTPALSSDTAEEIVYQSVTFTSQSTYSSVAKVLEGQEDLMFLFVGKDSLLGFDSTATGDRLMPGVGSTIEGFLSPTTAYYPATTQWSAQTGYIQLAVPAGIIVQAQSDGVVTKVGENTDAGKHVEVLYQKDNVDYLITYGNLDTIQVTESQRISQGDQIGITGSSAGHYGLLLSLKVDGVMKNPLQYFYQPVISSGASLFNIIGVDGKADPALVDQLKNELNQANVWYNGPYDKWHTRPYNIGITWQCPWWAWGRGAQFMEQNGGFPSNFRKTGWGNGGDFYDRNVSWKIFAYGQTPRANSWVCWREPGRPGHIAYVEGVESDGSFWISETYDGAYKCNGPRVKKINSNGYYGRNYSLEGFIYLDQPLNP